MAKIEKLYFGTEFFQVPTQNWQRVDCIAHDFKRERKPAVQPN